MKALKRFFYTISFLTLIVLLITISINFANTNIIDKPFLRYSLYVALIISFVDFLRFAGIQYGKKMNFFIREPWELRTKKEHNRFMLLEDIQEKKLNKKKESLFLFIFKLSPYIISTLNILFLSFALIIFIYYANLNYLYYFSSIIIFDCFFMYIKGFYKFFMFTKKGLDDI